MTTNRPAVARRKKAPPKATPRYLAEGDTVEYSVSASIRIPRQGEAWVKVGATTKVGPDESGSDAAQRVSAFVDDAMGEAISNLME